MDDFLPKIGDPIGEPAPSVFELVLGDYLNFINPKDYGIDEQSINPSDYFVTSGDAVEKTKVLERDLWNLAGELRKKCYNIIAEENSCTYVQAQEMYRTGTRPQNPAKLRDFETEIWRSAGASRKLLNALIKAKGPNIFLETEWDSHHLLCIPKNPRKVTQ